MILFISTHIIHIIYLIYYKHNIKSELIHYKYYEKEKLYNNKIEQKKKSIIFINSIKIKNDKNKLILLIPKKFIHKKILFFIDILRYSDATLDKFYCCTPKKNILTHKKLKSGLYLIIIKWKYKNNQFLIEKNIFI
jgi:hypothetical protein